MNIQKLQASEKTVIIETLHEPITERGPLPHFTSTPSDKPLHVIIQDSCYGLTVTPTDNRFIFVTFAMQFIDFGKASAWLATQPPLVCMSPSWTLLSVLRSYANQPWDLGYTSYLLCLSKDPVASLQPKEAHRRRAYFQLVEQTDRLQVKLKGSAPTPPPASLTFNLAECSHVYAIRCMVAQFISCSKLNLSTRSSFCILFKMRYVHLFTMMRRSFTSLN